MNPMKFSLRSLAAQFPATSTLTTSPGSHSATTSNGRQQTSQSVVKRCEAMLVSMTSSKSWPQKGHRTVSDASIVRKANCQTSGPKQPLFFDPRGGVDLNLQRWGETPVEP